MNKYVIISYCFFMLLIATSGCATHQKAVATSKENKAPKYLAFQPGAPWLDESGNVINAHGGGILYDKGTYYWFGEKRGRRTSEGINVYSSKDLYNWKFEALALAPNTTDTASEIAAGCIMERPKIIYNAKSKTYVLWFHLELRGKGYSAARAAVATSKKITGPYTYLHSFRPNGNMSRDMTLFADDDGKAYHVYSSRENYDLRLARLSDDYLSDAPADSMLFSRHREAPAMFKYEDKYYLITSAATGWRPNQASMHEAASVWGPWQLRLQNPMEGPGADSTFGGQSAFILPVAGKKDAFIFVADKWNPRNLEDSRYLWLPVQFKNGQPYIEWKDEWNISLFDKSL